MSSKSLADIISIIRFRGDYRSTVRFPDANIGVETQAAFAEFYELVVDTNEGYYDTTGTVSTAANTAFVALPTDCWRVRGIDRLDGTDYIALAQVGVDDRNRFSATTDEPEAYRLTARGIDLYPTPSAIYTLRVTYVPIAPTLSAAREYYNGWEEYTVYGALLRLAQNEESTQAAEWQRQLDIQRARIQRGASQRKAQEPEYLALRDGDPTDARETGWWW